METLWYIILISMLTIYIVLDGYDFGAGIVHLLWAKEERDKQLITKAIGPFWDANEVWLIAAGGVLFFAFPVLYAASFSGFYLPLILILWLLIFRGIGLELRGLVDSDLWRVVWDKAFGVASLLLALFFGLALGNVVRGVHLGANPAEPQYFFLPLWGPEFSPLSEELGIIDWFTVILGLVGLVTLTIHGANWIILKTNSSIHEKLKRSVFYGNIALGVLVIVSLIAWVQVRPDPFRNFIAQPLFFIFPLIALTGWVGLLGIRKYKRDGMGFLFSSLFIVGASASTATSLYPTLLRSTNPAASDLTVSNTTTTPYGLHIGLAWWVLAFTLVAIYFVVQYRVFRGKMDEVDYH